MVDVVRKFTVRQANLADASLLVPRRADEVEWRASAEGEFLDNLKYSIAYSNLTGESIAVIREGRPILIGGASPGTFSDTVLTWLVVAEGGEQWGLTLMKDYKEDLDGFFSRWPRTECYSDSRNTVHHRWLQYLGYELVGEVFYGPYDLPFMHFRRGF